MEIQEDPTAQKYFNPLTRMATASFIKNVLDEIESLQVDSILDIGCGTGYITKSLMAYSPNCIACDLDISRLKLAREYTNEGIPFIVADVTQLPFKRANFDLVMATEVLEHVPNIEAVLREIKVISRSYVLITVPSEPIFRIANFLRGKNLASFGNPMDHIHHFSKKSLRDLLSEYFSQVDIEVNSTFWLMATCRL